MTKILCVGDIHLSDKPPVNCTDSYTDDLFDLLFQTVDIASQLSVEAVVWAGDVFNHKSPRKTSHSLVQRAIDVVRSYPVPLYVVPGNHDMAHDRIESVIGDSPSQPLATLFKAGAILLYGWSELEDVSLFGVPWLQDWTNPDKAQEAIGAALYPLEYRRYEDRPVLIVTHAPFYPPGRELKYEFVPTSTFALSVQTQLVASTSIGIYYGHVHESHRSYSHGRCTFENAGSLCRKSWDGNLERSVSVSLWDSEEGTFERIPLNAKPVSEIFKVSQAEDKKRRVAVDSAFVDMVGATVLPRFTVESLADLVREKGLSRELSELVLGLVDGASTD